MLMVKHMVVCGGTVECPDFEVRGTYKGETFIVKVGLSLDDRDLDYEVISGLTGLDDDEYVDVQAVIVAAVNES